MAKGKYEKWLDEDNLILITGWARAGLSMEQIASNMGITKQTLYDWSKKFPAISDAIKKGKEVSDYKVENALYELALSGNIAAIIFWLKNRMPGQWKEKPVEANKESNEKLDELIAAIRGV